VRWRSSGCQHFLLTLQGSRPPKPLLAVRGLLGRNYVLAVLIYRYAVYVPVDQGLASGGILERVLPCCDMLKLRVSANQPFYRESPPVGTVRAPPYKELHDWVAQTAMVV